MTDPKIAEELAAYSDRLLGLLDPAIVRRVAIDRPDAAIIERYLALPDLTSQVADILDGLGYDSAVPRRRLPPLEGGRRVAGPAVTARQIPAARAPGYSIASGHRPKGGGIDQITLTRRGDVFVIDAGGVAEASSFGGILATASIAAGLAGIVVDGAVRDSASIKAGGLAVWSAGVTPRTGKHRLELAEFNGPVTIAGVQVHPGDLVLGDDDGLLFVPAALILEVIERAEAAASQESALLGALSSGGSAREAAAILHPSKW
ncbi:hypothetical protein ABAZ39_25915 (plasmid) [Azospirillum argentinense]|uniref:Putative 4-hydroxy-4-methyl-2-oxoglutarate aldolase n=1 Tax=Azospirillum argentinense TaxID=2970906 RepID=A0A060DWT3_9PROT|nr:RraA family protein [Azospirillum argentinense]AIB15334.1 hypothetical protein ABAZ39_25915 [Azospirillum argentinense]EZQ04139.1 dimethylmenaquinone methyltransferase [Azospirillum argentinense]